MKKYSKFSYRMERFGLRIDVWQGILVVVVALGITIKLFRCVKWSGTGGRRKGSNSNWFFFFFDYQWLVVVLRFQIGAFYFVWMLDTHTHKKTRKWRKFLFRKRINRPPMSGERLNRSLLQIRLYVQANLQAPPSHFPKSPKPLVRPTTQITCCCSVSQGQPNHFHSSFNLLLLIWLFSTFFFCQVAPPFPTGI